MLIFHGAGLSRFRIRQWTGLFVGLNRPRVDTKAQGRVSDMLIRFPEFSLGWTSTLWWVKVTPRMFMA